jgi:hypothetical protein
MSQLLKRWYVWLGLVLLLGLTGSVALIYSSRSRVNLENFDRIQKGMSLEEVEAILGKGKVFDDDAYKWNDGLNTIIVTFGHGRVEYKIRDLYTTWEAIEWYAKKGAAKVGITWQ